MWAQLITTVLGVWLTASPDLLGYTGHAATNDHIVGPTIASFAFVAVWEVMRGLRWVNVVLGGWLLIAPWVLGYGEWLPMVNSLTVGVAVMGLSFVKGTLTQRYGGGWSALLLHRNK
jgi:hypothetical protein